MSDAADTRARLAAEVIQGADGYLFHRDHDAVDQVTGALPLAPQDVAAWRDSIETRAAWCKANGIAFRMMIIPEKHVVYADKLPPTIVPAADRPALQILASLDADTRALCSYPVQPLIDARSVRETYLQTDTHWTFYAGFLAYRMLVDDLARSVPLPVRIDEADLSFAARTHVGDLGVRLEPERDERTETVGHRTARPFQRVFENKKFSRGALSIYESDDASLPRCVLFRDSFANYIIPHLIPTFSRLVVMSSDSMHYDLVRAERPDVVIFTIIERFLGMLDGTGQRHLPDDLTGPDFAALTGSSPTELAAYTSRA